MTLESRSDRPTDQLDRLFLPVSIAVVGASTSPAKLGSVMAAAVTSGGGVDIYPINPRVEAPGFHRSIESAGVAHGAPIDLAVLCIPAAATPAALRAAAEAGVGGAVICSGGFAEAGPEGVAVQAEIARIQAETRIRVLGPNTSGFFRPGRGPRVSFVPTVGEIRTGSVAVVAASGGMNHALSFLLSERGVGVGFGVGLGNCVDVTDADVLRYLSMDDSISAIALHVESVADGRALLDAVRAVSARKPVVALVVGRADVSAFSESHTGALATSWKVTRSLLAEAGAVVVDTDHELVDALAVLSRTRLPAAVAPGIGLVTAQAGPGLMVLDDLRAHGVNVPALHRGTQHEIAKLLPPITFQANPVDTGRPGESFADVLAATAADPGVDALVVYALAEPDAIDLADAVVRSGVADRLPIVLGSGGPAAVLAATADSAGTLGVPLLAGPTALAMGVRALVADARARYLAAPHEAPDAPDKHFAAVEERNDHSKDVVALRFPLDEHQAKDCVNRLGVRTPARRVCPDRVTAHRALGELELPVAVKILDATVVHKTDIGGVHLGVRTPADLDAALDALDAIDAPAYLVESMAAAGPDLILGVRRDPVFGPILVVGAGGTTAEAIGDVAIRGARVTPESAAAMLDDLAVGAMFDGWRGGPVLDRSEFARIAVALVRFVAAHPEIADLEINPLRATADGPVALDTVILPEEGQS
ncbi:acetate--CoA ligase family protein [Nocardia sp. NPDC052254]|uniref:acetate--CoA ligase family protein n=1 Tax=Nocardia sp. NPDC052254 TaxID=3155681 RepID=UPI003427F523